MSDCQKNVFQSRAEANVEVRRAKKHGRGAGDMRPYQCVYCGLWHLTSLSRAEQRRRWRRRAA